MLTFFENKAMRIKVSIGGLWESKLKARMSAYWGYVRNSGNLAFHEKWMSLLIPVLLYQEKYRNSK